MLQSTIYNLSQVSSRSPYSPSGLLTSLGSELAMRECDLLALIAPRGIVTAAIVSLFTLGLEQAGITEAHLLVSLTFSVAIGTVLLEKLYRWTYGKTCPAFHLP